MATVTNGRISTEHDDRTLVFLSDLHLATDPEKRDFFAHAELTALLDELIASPEPTDLIIAGDFFDLLQLTGPDRETLFQQEFGRAEYAPLLARLRQFTALPDRRTLYLIGNHDAEIGWNEPLRHYLLDSGVVSEISLAYTHTYHASPNSHESQDSAGRGCLVYCEHGNDYDGVNTIGDYTNSAVTPLGAHIVTDLVNYLEPLGRHASLDAPTSIADIDNIHPLGLIPWWFISTYFYQQVRRLVKYIVIPAGIVYAIFHLLPLYLLFERFGFSILVRGFRSLPEFEIVLLLAVVAFDSSALLLILIWLVIRYDFQRTKRRYGIQDPDDIFRRGARHYRRTCEALVSGALRPVHWPADEPWTGADLFVYGHTHTQALTELTVGGERRAFANTGTWTRKVIRIPTHFRLPPVFVPTYELTYVVARPTGAALRVELWERPKALEYRLPWTEWLATLGRRRRPLRPADLAPRRLAAATLPFRAGFAAPLAVGQQFQQWEPPARLRD